MMHYVLLACQTHMLQTISILDGENTISHDKQLQDHLILNLILQG